MLTRIKTDNITDFQVLKQDLGDNVVDVSKLDTPTVGNPGDVLTTDGMGNLLFAPVGGTPIALNSLTDVSTIGAQFGDVLRYDGAGSWVPSSTLGSGLFLTSLEDVTISTPLSNTHFLKYNGSQWVNTRVNVTDIQYIAAVAITNNFNDLANIDVAGAVPGQVLKFAGNRWIPGNSTDAGSINTLDDVDTASTPPQIGDTLVWNGTNWVPGELATSLGGLTDVDITTTPPGNGDALVFNGTSGKWEPLDIGVAPSSSNTYVVNTIAERNALSPAVGDQVFVRTGTDGEWQLWLWEGSAYYLISSRDTSDSDANTIEAIVTPLTISPVLLGNISNGSRVTVVTVEVTQAFDGAPTLTVGDATDNSRLMTNDLLDLGTVGTYTITTDYIYTNILDTDINGYFNPGGSTAGQARILVSYV